MPLGPRLRRALVASAAVLVLAPSGAFAQGAGDDQYSDPFGSEATPTPTPAPRTPAATATPAPAQPNYDPVIAQSGPAAAPAPTGPTLPYTGADSWLTALGGAALLGAGLTLRRRVRADDRA